jgi:ribosomal protein S12 methylthiotransferase accessory factor
MASRKARAAAISVLERAESAGRAAGVTRVGEITGLDRIGVPVFHAVRPWSRALSVHQGKGLTALEARIGALMEAVESAHAEAFAAPAVRTSWSRLAPDERAPCVGDFAATRSAGPAAGEPLDWTRARRIVDGGALWVPFEAVSLDLSKPGNLRLSRSSTGQAAHFDREAATRAALLELIERDAAAAWFAMSPGDRTETLIDPGDIPYGWFPDLQESILRADLALSLYRLPAIAPHPALLAEIVELARPGGGTLVAYGTACDPDPEAALRGAVLEAAQSRVTEISGARDDILEPRPAACAVGLALPPPFHMPLVGWERVVAGAAPASGSASAIADRLAAAGYPQAAVVDLSGPGSDVVVVKAFAPGLGALKRARRPALAVAA